MRDRSILISSLIAPLVLTGILGFAFGHDAPKGHLAIGVTGTTPAVVVAAAHATQVPPSVSVRVVANAEDVKRAGRRRHVGGRGDPARSPCAGSPTS